jgi:predicted lipoprotein with Yx(FWY)xxD motif
LVDENGRTLYIFTVDVGDVSACYDDCEQNWPVVGSGASVGDGIDMATGSTLRDGGNEQLTINGRPVYLFAGDSAPGDVNGQNVGEVWFVIGVDGEPIIE